MTKNDKEIATISPTSRKEWRQWLEANHRSSQSVWLIQYKKKSGKPSISWNEAVEEALCYGWIDSVRKTLDEERFIQFFSKRKAKGTWSKINKEKVTQLIEASLMTAAGYESIELAKQNGSWTILDEVEAFVIPEDLEMEFKNRPGSKDFFLGLSNSVRKAILQWIVLAKQSSTREKRIREVVELASQKRKPKQF